MKNILITCWLSLFLAACGSNYTPPVVDEEATEKITDPNYDPVKGIGKYTRVDLGPGIDEEMATLGQAVFQSKCMSCHKLSDQKMAAPGWKNITQRHTPEWILNFLTNTDEMIDKDPDLQAQLELFKVRMPDQQLTDVEARAVLEFMRKNDLQK